MYTDPDGRTPLVLALGCVVIGGTSLAIAGLIPNSDKQFYKRSDLCPVFALVASLRESTSLPEIGMIAVPVVLVGSVVIHPDGQRDLARGVDYVLAGGEGYVWRETLPPQAEIPDACTQSVDDVLVQAKGGKQKNENYVTQWAKAEAHKTGRDPCDILREAREQAIRDGNQKWFEDIVEAEKFLRCRNKAKRGRR